MLDVRHVSTNGETVQERDAVPLVVLGKNWQRHPPKLSIESRMNVLAAVEMLKLGLARTVIFSGGHTAGRAYPSEAAAMARYLSARLPPELRNQVDVRLDEISIDTAGNAEQVRAMLASDAVYLLTVRSHLSAAVRLFRTFGLPVTGTFVAEEILRGRSARHARLLSRYQCSIRATMGRATEMVRRRLLRVDSRGRVLRPITKVLRYGNA